MELPPAARKAIDLEGRDWLRTKSERLTWIEKPHLSELVHEIKEYRRPVEQKPLTLQGSDCAHVVQELNKAICRAEGLL
jgi:hypothetical protein